MYQMPLVPWKNIVPSRNYCWSNNFQSRALKIESKNLFLHFLSNHPETFRICSRDHLEEICRADF